MVAGNFEKENVKDHISKYFEDIPASNGSSGNQELELITPEVNLEKNIFIERFENVQLERVYFAWHTEKAYGVNDNSLDVLSDILTGSKGSRLTKHMVYDTEIAQDVSAFQFSGKYDGHYMIIATAKPGISISKLKEEIFKEIKNIAKNGIIQKELIKSKNLIKSSFINSMQNLDVIADHLNHYNFYLDEPNSFNFDLKRYEEVTDESIKKAVNKYLTKNYIELQIKPVDKKPNG